MSFSFDQQGLYMRSHDFFQVVKMGLCEKEALFRRENVKIQDKNKRDNVKYMHVNGLDYVRSII